MWYLIFVLYQIYSNIRSSNWLRFKPAARRTKAAQSELRRFVEQTKSSNRWVFVVNFYFWSCTKNHSKSFLFWVSTANLKKAESWLRWWEHGPQFVIVNTEPENDGCKWCKESEMWHKLMSRMNMFKFSNNVWWHVLSVMPFQCAPAASVCRVASDLHCSCFRVWNPPQIWLFCFEICAVLAILAQSLRFVGTKSRWTTSQFHIPSSILHAFGTSWFCGPAVANFIYQKTSESGPPDTQDKLRCNGPERLRLNQVENSNLGGAGAWNQSWSRFKLQIQRNSVCCTFCSEWLPHVASQDQIWAMQKI